MVLMKDFVPSLHTSFSTHRATISAVSIQKWREAHTAELSRATTVVKVILCFSINMQIFV